MALEVTPSKEVHCVSKSSGYAVEKAKSIVLAMGCRERTRGAIGTPGTRPAGVLTAGAAQLYSNINGYMSGKRVVILGSGDIGLIMARRMTLEGAKVLACIEIMPDSGGLTRNIVQCLRDYDIPLYLSHTVTEIRGRNRVEQIEVAKVDEKLKPIPGSEFIIECDTLMLSVGLIPENELTRGAGIKMDASINAPIIDENTETSLAGVFACGNVAHVHDLVDFVTAEAETAGAAAAAYVLGKPMASGKRPAIQVERKGVPPEDSIVCVVCPKGCRLKVTEGGMVTGNQCKRGITYGQQEQTNPIRAVTSTVRITGAALSRCPVKIDRPIPKALLVKAVEQLDSVTVSAPVAIGQAVLENVLDTGANFVITRAM
jgi:CxxC motif-containing protein/NADPH-dependent 2,4-dienoyl-CoA reductase/sulfur reductase-like enzyme